MARPPTTQVLEPNKALITGMMSGRAPVTSTEDLNALKTLGNLYSEEYQPKSPTDFMYLNILVYSYYRLHRVWLLSADTITREINAHGAEFAPLIAGYKDRLIFIESVLEGFKQVPLKPSNALGLATSILKAEFLQSYERLQNAARTLISSPGDTIRDSDIEAVTGYLMLVSEDVKRDLASIENLAQRLAKVNIISSPVTDLEGLSRIEDKLLKTIEKCVRHLEPAKRAAQNARETVYEPRESVLSIKMGELPKQSKEVSDRLLEQARAALEILETALTKLANLPEGKKLSPETLLASFEPNDYLFNMAKSYTWNKSREEQKTNLEIIKTNINTLIKDQKTRQENILELLQEGN